MKPANEKRKPSTRGRSRRAARAEPDRLRKIDLARELGISRVSLDKYLNRDGSPKPDRHFTYSVEETAQFIASQKTEDAKVKGQAFWAAEKARLQCEQLAAEIARTRGDYLPREEVAKTLQPLIVEIAEMIQAKFVRELPSRYKGRDAIECATMNQAACDAIAERFRKGALSIT